MDTTAKTLTILGQLSTDNWLISKITHSFPQINTERELQVLFYILNFYDNREISDQLCISPKTVKHHSTSIYKKAGIKNRRLLLAGFYQSAAEREIRLSAMQSGVCLPYGRLINHRPEK